MVAYQPTTGPIERTELIRIGADAIIKQDFIKLNNLYILNQHMHLIRRSSAKHVVVSTVYGFIGE